MKLNSSEFEDGGSIPSKYTCDGKDINPPLQITGVPERAQSLVLIVEDPDAPGGTFVHWTAWNIDPTTEEIEEDSTPKGAVEGQTDFDEKGYGGPCPPSGTHRYFFKMYALDDVLNLSTDSSKEELETAIKNRVVDSAELVGKYSRE